MPETQEAPPVDKAAVVEWLKKSFGVDDSEDALYVADLVMADNRAELFRALLKVEPADNISLEERQKAETEARIDVQALADGFQAEFGTESALEPAAVEVETLPEAEPDSSKAVEVQPEPDEKVEPPPEPEPEEKLVPADEMEEVKAEEAAPVKEPVPEPVPVAKAEVQEPEPKPTPEPTPQPKRKIKSITRVSTVEEKNLLGNMPPSMPISHGMGMKQAQVLRKLIVAMRKTPFKKLDPDSGGDKLDDNRPVYLTLLAREKVCQVRDALVKTPRGNIRWGKKVIPDENAEKVLNDYIHRHPAEARQMRLKPV